MYWIKAPEERERWHVWFAWHPVTVSDFPDGAKKRVWLQKVLRCGKLNYYHFPAPEWSWSYKEIK